MREFLQRIRAKREVEDVRSKELDILLTHSRSYVNFSKSTRDSELALREEQMRKLFWLIPPNKDLLPPRLQNQYGIRDVCRVLTTFSIFPVIDASSNYPTAKRVGLLTSKEDKSEIYNKIFRTTNDLKEMGVIAERPYGRRRSHLSYVTTEVSGLLRKH